jgi:PIN domain nuclease of toxin-antitoxin system
MKFLLDTHLILWATIDDPRIKPAARALLANTANQFIFSVASLWEMAIKRSQSKAGYPVEPAELRRHLVAAGYDELPITGPHAIAVEYLPAIHRDPFDRLLIAQAMTEGLTLLTADATVARYPGPIRKV